MTIKIPTKWDSQKTCLLSAPMHEEAEKSMRNSISKGPGTEKFNNSQEVFAEKHLGSCDNSPCMEKKSLKGKTANLKRFERYIFF